MERLWAPWRIEYILTEKVSGCIFCVGDTTDRDRELLVLFRSSASLVMLNRYPYTNGHLMIAPYRHVSDLDLLSDAEMLDLFKSVRLCRTILQETASPQGFNIGVNMGKAAGAGVDEHLHIHVVPRWNGDTNYMSVIADIRVMPENLMMTYDRLLPAFRAASRGDG
jgi:ATP adenylyltransferase